MIHRIAFYARAGKRRASFLFLSRKNCDDRPRVRNKEKEEEFTGGFTTMAIHHRAGPPLYGITVLEREGE